MSIKRTPSPAPSESEASTIYSTATTPEARSSRQLECPSTPRSRPERLASNTEMGEPYGYRRIIEFGGPHNPVASWAASTPRRQLSVKSFSNGHGRSLSAAAEITPRSSPSLSRKRPAEEDAVKEDPVVVAARTALSGLKLGSKRVKIAEPVSELGNDRRRQENLIRIQRGLRKEFEDESVLVHNRNSILHMIADRKRRLNVLSTSMRADRVKAVSLEEMREFKTLLDTVYRPQLVNLSTQLAALKRMLTANPIPVAFPTAL